MIRVLIADDHPIFRQGLRQVLSEDEDITVIADVDNGRKALDYINTHEVDVVTMDISMPEMTGLDALKQIRVDKPDLPVLILSIYPEEQFAIRALKAGASGYLTKSSVPDELVQAVRQAAAGQRYISESLSQSLAQAMQEDRHTQLPHERLTDREYEVFQRIARGETVSDIATDLNLSVKTVSTHRAHILAKMQLNSNAQLMRYALDNQLVE
ncbi:MAG: response regulator transcription factor [Spartobacteria bacterium]|nr:response regulator transcription factor [Spartobacteria bacterium]